MDLHDRPHGRLQVVPLRLHVPRKVREEEVTGEGAEQ